MKIQMNKNFIEKINNLKQLFYLKQSKKNRQVKKTSLKKPNRNVDINKNRNENENKNVNKNENKEENKKTNNNIEKKSQAKNNRIINVKEKNIRYSRSGANKSYFKYKFKIYLENFFKNKQKIAKSYYVLLFFMLLLGILSVYITIKAYNSFSKEDYTTVFSNNDNIDSDSDSDNDNGNSNSNSNSNSTSNVDIYENKEQKDNSLNENNSNNKEAEDENVKTVKENNKENSKKIENTTLGETKNTKTDTSKKDEKKAEEVKIVPLSFSKPLDGKIIKPYSMDTVVYSKTLELWKTHDGIDIAGNIGDSVKSIERGTIKKIYDDSFYGRVIIIDHGQGYESMYGNLQEEVLVKEKQSVKKGQSIAKIGNTAIGEIKDESHIHFQLFKDSKSIDPTNKLNYE